MSDTEEVVIPRATKPQLKINTKPEIAREKLKEKRERLKKEKENMLIEEAKKRLASESEKKLQEEALLKQQEEEKKKADPSFAMLMKMEEMMKMMSERHVPIAVSPLDDYRGTGKVAKAKGKTKKVEEEEEPEKPKRKPRVPKEPIQHQPSQGLLNALMGRRNMNSFNF